MIHVSNSFLRSDQYSRRQEIKIEGYATAGHIILAVSNIVALLDDAHYLVPSHEKQLSFAEVCFGRAA